jgi:hypothetical protein
VEIAWVPVWFALAVASTFGTLPRPTIELVIPDTVPVKVGEASGAFAARAVSRPVISERPCE